MMGLLSDALDGLDDEAPYFNKPSKVFNPVLSASEGLTDLGESPLRDGRTNKTKGSTSNHL